MTAQVAQIDGTEKPLRQKGANKRQDAEVPPCPHSGPQCAPCAGPEQRQQHAHGCHRAIGRDEDCSDVERTGCTESIRHFDFSAAPRLRRKVEPGHGAVGNALVNLLEVSSPRFIGIPDWRTRHTEPIVE